MKDNNGIDILEGSVIIADGYGKGKRQYYCVEYIDGIFGSCAYSDFEPISRYNSIIVKDHCSNLLDVYKSGDWSGNLGAVIKSEPVFDYHSDWNELIRVCKKWSELEFDGRDQTWEYDFYTEKLQKLAGQFEITLLFNQLVKNIEWYNSTKDK